MIETATETTTFTWPYGYGHNGHMKTLAAGKFKDICLQTLDEVAASRRPVVITKRGRPVAKLVPITAPSRARSLVGSVVAESGDPYRTGEVWDADRT
jgi:antitoxin (DNA-binding transcriptional repressor) of toxin-antitoxin stability system